MNLDAMNADELRAVAEDRMLHWSLREYAQHKRYAMAYRGLGLIQRAISEEASADLIYAHIPVDLRW